MKKTSASPEMSTQITNDTQDTMVTERAARPKKSAPVKTRARPSATKVQAPADTPSPKNTKAAGKSPSKTPNQTPVKTTPKTPAPKASQVAIKTSTRSPARSATQTKTRKPARLKTPALPHDAALALSAEPLSTEKRLAEQTPATVCATDSSPTHESKAAETPPSPAEAPVVNDAELWEQGSPIRIRIAQLRTRNALLEEQLQSLRPLFQVRGKKK